ncbi:MAG TPA: CRISPR-associated helicase Cas3' [Coleofasciculaceae cyanobacterium]|jgi:CRISPR-associated endonuclease/helicase Cas3
MHYADFFKQVTEKASPYPWQEAFSHWTGNQVAVVSAPTGAGKESGAVLPWLYGHKYESGVPSRLIYCLPTRSLVDQVYSNIKKLVVASGLNISVYCLKGGLVEHGYEDVLTSKAIIIGTQDQLITRALNRGYSVPWSQRPKHAAALNNDCRWVLDETQLMGVGYPTAIQLHQLRKQLGTYGKAELVVMSATLDREPLRKYNCNYEEFGLSDDDYNHPFLGTKLRKSKLLSQAVVHDEEDIAALAIAHHQAETLSLIVLNTVKKARKVGDCLKSSGIPYLVLHSRFLGWKRSELQQQLYSFKGIVVATQVVEAGVDIDSRVLITEPCPWSSLKQRVGRCGRTDMEQESQVFWLWQEGLDQQSEESFRPYSKSDCLWTVEQLRMMDDVGLIPIEQVEAPFHELEAEWIEEREINHFFTRSDPSFSASDCVRDGKNLNCRVFWSTKTPKHIPHQDSLCPVPIHQLRQLTMNQTCQPMVWADGWNPATKIDPGDVVCLPYESGGYDDELGWTGNAADQPNSYELKFVQFYDDDPPFPHWLTLDVHSGDAAYFLESYRPILSRFMSEPEVDLLVECAKWHDWGKAHEIWQHYANGRAFGEFVAKSTQYGNPRMMSGYRHELASAIAAGHQGKPFLAQYVIATHHGKIRESLDEIDGTLNRQAPRGVVLGSILPSCTLGGEAMPEIILSFDPDPWKRSVRKLLKQFGVFKLWYLETLIRNADVAASRMRQEEARKKDKYPI